MTPAKTTGNILFHVDIDAFYASVEQEDNPDLRGKPVVVGALPGHRGVVSACSYEARRYGIRSAMPISEAYRRCPDGVFLPVRMKRYIEVSRRIMICLKSYSPAFHQISIDEAGLDMTGMERLYGSPRETGKRMKEEVKGKTGLTISVGIAANRYLAKLASEACKPDGMMRVETGGELAFLDTLKLKDLWGVGAKTLERLHELNITSIPSLRALDRDMLRSAMGDTAGRYLFSAVRGEDPGIHSSRPRSHSISGERTFEIDRKDPQGVGRTLLELCQEVAGRLIEEDKRSRTVALKLRFHDFTTVNAQKTLRHPVGSSEEMYRIVTELLQKRWNGHTPIRLLGVGVTGVENAACAEQQELFPNMEDRSKKVEETVIDLKKRLKGITLTRASLLRAPAGKSCDPGGSGPSTADS